MIAWNLLVLAAALLTSSAQIDELDLDNALCNMCRGDDACLNILMTKLHIRRCIVDGQLRTIMKRYEPANLREILLDSYLRKLR